jgi:protein-tyrosine phosphatase
MKYIAKPFKAILQTGPCQYLLNKCRSITYPWLFNKWEANKITEDYNIWLGSLESACDREALSKHNIHRVVTAVYDINPIFEDDPDIQYLKVPVIDKPNAKISKHFDRAVDFIHEGVTGKNKGKGVLIHCVFGVSRSSTLVCAYLIKKHNLSVANAVRYVKQCRPQVDPNRGFLLQLQAIEDEKRESERARITNERYAKLRGLSASPTEKNIEIIHL